jgi:hypothetical protein
MFFEPMLTIPLHRNIPFSLQQLCRTVICSHISYDAINKLNLPTSIIMFLEQHKWLRRSNRQSPNKMDPLLTRLSQMSIGYVATSDKKSPRIC